MIPRRKPLPNFGASGVQTATAAGSTVTAVAQGGLNIAADIAALASIAGLFSSPGKENYNKILKPNALKVIDATGRDFITGAQAVGWNSDEVASALSQYLGAVGVKLTPQQLIDDAQPSTSAVSSGIGANISQAFQSFASGLGPSGAPIIILGGGALVLFLLLRK